MGDKPLKDAYPSLYFTCFDHDLSAADAIEKGWHNFSFRRTPQGDSLELWNSLKDRCEEVMMHGAKDKPMWMFAADRQFTVKSLYMFLIKADCGFPHNFLWKTKIPAKIKVFLWLVNKKSILTKDNLLRG